VGGAIRLAPVAAALVIGAAFDLFRRRVPNWVSAPAALAGLAHQATGAGLAGLGSGAAAGVLTIALLWVPWTAGRLGGGDVKLGAAAAMATGLGPLPGFFLCSAAAAGGLALVSYALSKPAARSEIRGNLKTILQGQSMIEPPLKAEGRVSVPLGTAFALGFFTNLLVLS